MVDDSFMTDTQYKVTNQLVIPNISRNDLHSIFTCQATNNNVSVPVSTSVKLDITCNAQSHLEDSTKWRGASLTANFANVTANFANVTANFANVTANFANGQQTLLT